MTISHNWQSNFIYTTREDFESYLLRLLKVHSISIKTRFSVLNKDELVYNLREEKTWEKNLHETIISVPRVEFIT